MQFHQVQCKHQVLPQGYHITRGQGRSFAEDLGNPTHNQFNIVRAAPLQQRWLSTDNALWATTELAKWGKLFFPIYPALVRVHWQGWIHFRALDDLWGLFQPRWFYNSMILSPSCSEHPGEPGKQVHGPQDLQKAAVAGGRCRLTLMKGAQWQEEMWWAQVANHKISNRKMFFFSPWGWSDIGLAVKSSSLT